MTKRGRPTHGFTDEIKFKTTPEQKQALQDHCNATGRQMSAVIRIAIDRILAT